MLRGKVGLSEYLSVGVIAKVFPMRSVQAALRDCNRLSRRRRELSAEAVMYYVIARGLFRSLRASAVLEGLADGLRWARASVPMGTVASSSISRARSRLGTKPFKALRRRTVRPLADKRTWGAWYGDMRVLAYDSVLLEVPSEKRNKEVFGKCDPDPTDSTRPRARVTFLVEVGTRAAFAWSYGPYEESRQKQARRLHRHISLPTLLLAGQGYLSEGLWKAASETGAELLWKAGCDDELPCQDSLADGSFRSSVGEVPVRVAEYSIEGSDDPPCRLVTTLLDPEQAPAVELAALYHERWQLETARDQVTTHTLCHGSILRSKAPRLIEQEIEGLMLAHYAVRHFQHEVARVAHDTADQLSFIRAVRVVPPRSESAFEKRPEA